MHGITFKKILTLKNYLTFIALVLLTSVSYFSFSMDDSWQFDVFSNDIMISNILSDDVLQQNSEESILLQQIIDPAHMIKDVYVSGADAGTFDFVNYTSQVGLHGVIQSFFSKVSPFSRANTLRLLYLTNSFLLSVVLLTIFQQLDRFLNTNYWFLLSLLTAALFSDVMKYGNNLYWNGWAIFLPFAVSLLFVNSRFIKGKFLYPFAFLSTFAPLFLKLLFSYEFVSTIMISQIIPFIFYLIANKVEVTRALKILAIASLGAIAAFAMTIAVHLLQNMLAYGNLSAFFLSMGDTLMMRLSGDPNPDTKFIADAASIGPIGITIKYLTIEMFAFFSASILFVHVLVVFVLTFIYNLFVTSLKSDHKLAAFGITTGISFLAPLSWYVLATPHSYIHVDQCVTLWYLPVVFMVIIYVARSVKIMLQNRISPVSDR